VDILVKQQITGTLIDVSVAGERRVGEPVGTMPALLTTHYYLVVDDGRRDEVRPGFVNRDIARGTRIEGPPRDAQALDAYVRQLTSVKVAPGDIVRLTGERFSWYVTELERGEKPIPALWS
jgi:hypothetical protein